MNLRPLRAKIAALAVLFFVGTFAGQVQRLLDSVRGKVDRGAEITGEIRSTVSTIGQAVDDVEGLVGQTAGALEAKVADLQAKLAAGTATPGQVVELRGLLERTQGRTGAPGPPGPRGAAGPPGPPTTPPPSTSSTTAGGTSSTTRPAPPTSTTTRPPPTTTTTRCMAGVGRLVRIGC